MGSSEMDPGEEEGEDQPILFDKIKTSNNYYVFSQTWCRTPLVTLS